MSSELFVNKITGTSGTSGGAPITLSGDTATLGSGVTIGSAVTGTLGSAVTFPVSLTSQIPRAYFMGTTYNNSTAPTLTATSGVSGTLTSYGVILVSQPLGFASTEYLLDFSIVLSGITGFSTTGSVSLNGFTHKYRLPIHYQGIAGLGNAFQLEESRTDGSGVLWFFEWNDTPGTSAGATHGISAKVISTTKPDWVY